MKKCTPKQLSRMCLAQPPSAELMAKPAALKRLKKTKPQRVSNPVQALRDSLRDLGMLRVELEYLNNELQSIVKD